MKLFIREPITMFFTFALPLLFLFVMGGVLRKMTNGGAGDFHGLSAMAFYTPAYIALVLTSVGIVGLPGHLTGYRKRGFYAASGLRHCQSGAFSGRRAWSVWSLPLSAAS